MSTAIAETISRKPQQGRSKASLERMLAATERLMLERGSEDFTLQDVSRDGSVSIGSIYLRFDGKDHLVRSVIDDFLARLAAEEQGVIGRVRREAASLACFLPAFVDAYGDILSTHAPLLRLTMLRAEYDPLVSESGKRAAFHSERLVTDAMLAFCAEIAGHDAQLKVTSAYRIIFSTLARQLSLGSSGESVHDADWTQLKRELGRMCLAYLKHGD